MVYILSWSWADSTHDLNNVTKLHNHETNGERLVAFLNISQGTVAIKECKNKVKGQHHDSAKVRGQHHNSAKGRLCTTTKPHDPVPTCWHSTSVRTHAYTRVHTHTHTTHTHTHTHTNTHTHTHHSLAGAPGESGAVLLANLAAASWVLLRDDVAQEDRASKAA